MLLTIHDANLQKVAFIDNEKQSTLNYYDDTWTRNLETGSSTFEFTVFKKAIQSDTTRQKTYNYLNEKAFVSFKYNGKSYVFSVMTVEEDEQTIKCYCENLNLELINEYANPYKATKAMSFVEYCNAMDLLNFTHLTVGINEISDQKRTLEWEGQDTKLARLLSLATKFDAEIDFDTELNADSSIKAFKVNVYHENDDNHQGVGRVRNDIQLTYGKNLKSIKRKIDKTGIYTMIRPTGKGKTKNAKGEEVETVVTIGCLGAWSENNADGVREFYQSGEALYAPLAAQMYPSTFTSGTQKDQWIRKDLVVESDNPTVIRTAAIRDLKKNAYPALTYEVDGFLDVEIGDTIKIYDDGFTPILLIRARVSDQKISFTNPTSNKTTFANFKALENALSDGIQAAFERLFEASKPYLIKLSTDNGVIFKNQIGQSLVTPTLYKGGKPVTTGVTWRWSLDGDVTTGMTYLVKGSSVTDTVTLTVAAYVGNDEVAVDEITLVNVVDGTKGTPGTPGKDGRTPYVHTAWANNETGTSGFSLDSSINKLYIGIYTDYEENDSTDPTKYQWAKVKGDKGEKGDRGPQGERGLQGLQGAKGDQGIAGAKGADGRTQYTHIAYSDSSDGRTNFSVSASNRKYIGMYVDFTSADSTNPADYAWTLVKGADGANGTPGKTGADGRTPYFHTAYANSYDGQQDFSVTDSANKKYLGTYTDYTQSDSTDYRVYTWTLIKGDDGTGIANVTNYYLATNQSTGVTLPTTRNLALGTSADWNTFKTITSTTGSNLSASLHKIINDGLVVGDTLHIYLEISADYLVAFNSSSNTTMLIQTYGDVTDWDNDGRLFNRSSERITVATNNPKKYEFNITLTEKMLKNNFWFLGVRFDGVSSVKYHTKAVKVEKGTVGTPWEAALEDLGWTTTPQQLSYTKRFLWNYRIELYTDGTTKTTEPTVIGVHGEKGDQGERGLQGLQGEKGDKGIQGEKGADGKSSYTHIAYATNSTGTQGFSVSDSTNKTYIGMYVDNVEADSTIPSKYNWTLVKGADGAQGVPGVKGSDGRTPYLHLAYATNATGTQGFSVTDSANKTYIGQYTDFTQNDSTDPTKYKWTLIKGEKGEKGDRGATGAQGIQGLQGPKGDQGIAGKDGSSLYNSKYTGIKANLSGMYITDLTPSVNIADLVIGSKVISPSGDVFEVTSKNPSSNPPSFGVGALLTNIKGKDGLTQYTHIAYADNATGGGFSQTDQTKAYIGMYQDFNATDSTNPASYRWTKWKGSDGAQGIPGPKGADGRTPYIHWAYSDSADGTGLTTSDNGQRYIGHYSDYTQADSTDKTKYTWADRWAKIDVGTRNLWIQSKTTGGFVTETLPANHVTGQRTCYKLLNNTEISFNIEPDFSPRLYRKVTFSAWIKYENVAQGANNWNKFNCFKHRMVRKNSSTGTTTGTDHLTLEGFTGTSDWKYITYTYDYSTNKSYDRLKTTIIFNLEGVASGTAWVTGVMVQFGNVATDCSQSPEDVQAQIDSKADQVLTQEQLNALNERNQILEAEMQAKASMEAFSKLEKAYNAFVAKNEKDTAQSEKDLIEAGRRIELLTTQFGGLKELKTFIDTYMTSSNEGLIIGKNDASSTFKVSSDRISMFSAGREVMYISQGVIHIDNGIFTASVQIGKFRTEQYHLNADMNVIRYVG